MYATPRRPAVSAKTGRHVQRCGVAGAPASGRKGQPFRTPGRVSGYMSTSLAGTSGDEIIENQEVETEKVEQYDIGTTTGAPVPPTARGLYVTARTASVPRFFSQLSPCTRRSTPIVHQYVATHV